MQYEKRIEKMRNECDFEARKNQVQADLESLTL